VFGTNSACITPLSSIQIADPRLPAIGPTAALMTVGQFNADNGRVFLKNGNTGGGHDFIFVVTGGANQVPVVGDWNGDGKDNVGVYNPRIGFFSLRTSNTSGRGNLVFTY